MKKILFAVFAALLMATSAVAAPIGIATGNTTGTFWPMGEDIRKTCSTPASPITNVVSDGSLDNIFKVYGDKSSQYGIVDVGSLFYQKGQDPKMMERIQMVFPFFSSELHLIAPGNSRYTSVNDLQGKRVIEGPAGSGTWVNAQVVKTLTGLSWQGIEATQKDGLAMIQNGQADAMWIMAGKPIGMLTTAQGIKLLSVQNPKLDQFGLYTKTMISTGTYPFQKSAAMTYKVDSVLVTFAFKNQYQKEIGDLVSCISHNLGYLQTNGHPKWRDVDPTDIERIQWQAHPAAVAAIKREIKK